MVGDERMEIIGLANRGERIGMDDGAVVVVQSTQHAYLRDAASFLRLGVCASYTFEPEGGNG